MLIPAVLLIGLALVVGFFAFRQFGFFAETITLAPNSLHQDLGKLKMITLLPKDAIKALTNPEFETVEESLNEMKDDEQVIGLSINGESRAYPLNVLSRHEVVNDVVGGTPVAVTF